VRLMACDARQRSTSVIVSKKSVHPDCFPYLRGPFSSLASLASFAVFEASSAPVALVGTTTSELGVNLASQSGTEKSKNGIWDLHVLDASLKRNALLGGDVSYQPSQ